MTRPAVQFALLACLAAALSACEAAAFFAQAISNDTPAIYKLQDRPTAILVDDPTNQLGDPSLEGMIASQVGFELNQKGTVKTVIDPAKIAELVAREGAEYSNAPVDRIGRTLGAAQVISIYIESAEANADEEAYRPNIKMRVKVVDAAAGKRLFPALDPFGAGDEATAARGYPVSVSLFYRTTIRGGQGDAAVVLRKLTEKAGRDVARLFFSHREHEPGEKFSD